MSSREDDILTSRLRACLAALDPVPTHLVDAAKASFAWKRADEELAELAADSATGPLTGVRSTGDPTEARLLTFEGAGLTVEVEVTPEGDERRLIGQLVPPGSAQVDVRWPGGSVTSEADTLGLFSASAVPAGPVSVACRRRGESQIVTTWITI